MDGEGFPFIPWFPCLQVDKYSWYNLAHLLLATQKGQTSLSELSKSLLEPREREELFPGHNLSNQLRGVCMSWTELLPRGASLSHHFGGIPEANFQKANGKGTRPHPEAACKMTSGHFP